MTLITFLTIGIAGCSTQYSLLYKADVKPNFKTENNDQLTFNLLPLYNGILFSVHNNSDQTARIIWDKSYFIMPDGNSFRALNTDILKEQKEIVDKAKYVSTIPSRSTFTRFTTATLNANKIRFENINAFYSSWNNYNSVNIKYLTEEFIRYGIYWPNVIKINVPPAFNDEERIRNENATMDELNPLGNKMINNNNLGLGLVIEQNGIEKEYRFDIRISTIDAVKQVATPIKNDDGVSEATIQKYIIDYTFDLSANKWERNGAELKN